MRKHLVLSTAIVAIVTGVSLPAAAQPSGTGASGSAGLGIDYTALVSAGGSGNPGVALPGSSAAGTVGSPIAGIARHFARAKRTK